MAKSWSSASKQRRNGANAPLCPNENYAGYSCARWVQVGWEQRLSRFSPAARPPRGSVCVPLCEMSTVPTPWQGSVPRGSRDAGRCVGPGTRVPARAGGLRVPQGWCCPPAACGSAGGAATMRISPRTSCWRRWVPPPQLCLNPFWCCRMSFGAPPVESL